MYKSLGAHVGFTRFLCGVIGANLNMRFKFSRVRFINAIRQARCFCFSRVAILHVDRHRYITKIGYSIIEFVAIDMIDLSRRPYTMNHEPCRAMQFHLLLIYRRFAVTMLNCANLIAGRSLALRVTPSKYPGVRIVFYD